MELIDNCPENIIKKYNIFPFRKDKDNVYIALSKNNNTVNMEHLSLIFNSNIIPVFVTEESVKNLISKYDNNTSLGKLTPVKSINTDTYTNTLEEAINNSVSDIHIEPQAEGGKIRFRKDGELYLFDTLSTKEFLSAVSKFKVNGHMDIAERRLPQDGKISYDKGGVLYDCRISSLRTVYGEKLVIRILYKDSRFSSLEELNFSKENLDILKKIIALNSGIILVTGPTGSGKSTTLYGILQYLNKESLNITTIEDPVEFNISGINQININLKAGINFSVGLRSVLRQDPDVIMIGEIRDEETAEIAVRAAITGHKIFSTIHTNDSAGVIFRLQEMGIEKYLLIDALVGIITQRLVKKNCVHCITKYEASLYEKEVLGVNSGSKLYLYKSSGCKHCDNKGYMGRTMISEVVYIDSNIKNILRESSGGEVFREYINKKNPHSIINHCKSLLLNGITSFDEFYKNKIQIDGILL